MFLQSNLLLITTPQVIYTNKTADEQNDFYLSNNLSEIESVIANINTTLSNIDDTLLSLIKIQTGLRYILFYRTLTAFIFLSNYEDSLRKLKANVGSYERDTIRLLLNYTNINFFYFGKKYQKYYLGTNQYLWPRLSQSCIKELVPVYEVKSESNTGFIKLEI